MASIYERIGGAPAVAATVDDLYGRILGDERLAGYFANTDMPRQKRHLRAFIAAALGGPQLYAGRDMHGAHSRLAVTSEAFDRVVEHLVAVLGGLGVRRELVEAIGAKLAPLRSQIVSA
jgi:hemoglobin